MNLPPNMMTVTARLTTKVGTVERTVETSICVQTHLVSELEKAVRIAWEQTREQENDHGENTKREVS